MENQDFNQAQVQKPICLQEEYELTEILTEIIYLNILSPFLGDLN